MSSPCRSPIAGVAYSQAVPATAALPSAAEPVVALPERNRVARRGDLRVPWGSLGQRRINYVKVGGRVRFKPEVTQALIDAQTVPSASRATAER